MDVGNLANLATLVESLQKVVGDSAPKETAKAPTVDAVRQQAQAAGVDPDLAEQVFVRLDKQVTKNIVNKQVTQEDIIEALLHVVVDPDAAPLRRRKKSWGELRQALRQLGARLGVSLAELDAVTDETGFGFKPDLHDVAMKITEWLQRN